MDAWCATRTNIDNDDELISGIMSTYGLQTELSGNTRVEVLSAPLDTCADVVRRPGTDVEDAAAICELQVLVT